MGGSHPAFKFSSQNFLFFFPPSSAAEVFFQLALLCFFLFLYLTLPQAQSSQSSLWCCISQGLSGSWYLTRYSWKYKGEARLFPVFQLPHCPLALKSWEIPFLWLCGFVLWIEPADYFGFIFILAAKSVGCGCSQQHWGFIQVTRGEPGRKTRSQNPPVLPQGYVYDMITARR